MKKIFCVILCFSFFVPVKVSAAELSVPAKSAIVVNGDTGAILYSQNANERLPMASTTKIMTALLLCENADLKKEVITTTQMVTVEGSSMGLLAGDKVTFGTLLYGLMLPSGNDAANTVAIALGGSIKGFSIMMNKKAAEIGMNNTNFVTPSGLDDKLHYSTAADMAKLAVYAMKNPVFKRAAGTKSIRVKYGNPPYLRRLFGHNKMLTNYNGANGIKTGYTSVSGRCLVSSAEREGESVIAVTLHDSSTVSSHTSLLNYGFEKLIKTELTLPEAQSFLEVISGEKSKCLLNIPKSFIGLTPSEKEKLQYKVFLPKFCYAPLRSGKKVGVIKYYIGNNFVKAVDIFSAETVSQVKVKKLTLTEKFLNVLKEFLTI